MTKTLLMLACSLLLAGCGEHHSQAAAHVEFVGGATQDQIIRQLVRAHATFLTNTPDLVRAEFQPPEMKKPMQVELTFTNNKLAGVNYIPQ